MLVDSWSMLCRYLRTPAGADDVLDAAVGGGWDAAEDGAELLEQFGMTATAKNITALNREIRRALQDEAA